MRALRGTLGFGLILLAGLGLPGCDGGGDGAMGRGSSLPERPSAPLPEGAEAWSFLGNALFPPPMSADVEAVRAEALAAAEADLAARPDDPEAWIWVGRQHAYRGAYGEAIAVFTEGADRFSDDARFLRHRGHRWITLRELARAEQDLGRAAAMMGAAGADIEPDGMPNAAGIPLTTLAFNVHYHRALALYLMANLPAAEAAWRETLAVSDNPDLDVAARYWFHLTLRKQGRHEDAARLIADLHADVPLLENETYRDLLLHFRGDLDAAEVLARAGGELPSVTALYGVAMHALFQGDDVEGMRTLQSIMDRPTQWASFGYLAAELELARAPR